MLKTNIYLDDQVADWSQNYSSGKRYKLFPLNQIIRLSLFQDHFISNIDPTFHYLKLIISPVVDNKKSKIFNSKDLIAYFLVAGTGAVVQLLCSSLFKDWFGLTFQESILPAYAASFVVG